MGDMQEIDYRIIKPNAAKPPADDWTRLELIEARDAVWNETLKIYFPELDFNGTPSEACEKLKSLRLIENGK